MREIAARDARGADAPGWRTRACRPAGLPRGRLTRWPGAPTTRGWSRALEPYPYADAVDLVAGERPLVVALDGVTDPQNLGAIARVAECAGANGLVLPRHRAAHVTAAVCRASAGAVEHLPIAIVPNLADWLLEIRRPGLWTYAADAGASLDYTAADLADGSVIVIGAEGKGVRPRVREACDAVVGIPLRGRIESLNAGTAAAILAFEAARQRRL